MPASTDPYRSHRVATPRAPTTVLEDGSLLLVSDGGWLADVCVKCATLDGVGRRFEVMPHGVASAIVVFLLCSTAFKLAALLVASALQSGEAWLWLLGSALSVWIAGYRWLRIGTLSLPICGACDARWRAVVRARRLASLGILPVIVVSVVAYEFELRGRLPRGTGDLVTLALIFAWGAILLALRRGTWRDRTVTSTAIEGELICLRGVDAGARRALRAGSRRRRLGAKQSSVLTLVHTAIAHGGDLARNPSTAYSVEERRNGTRLGARCAAWRPKHGGGRAGMV